MDENRTEEKQSEGSDVEENRSEQESSEQSARTTTQPRTETSGQPEYEGSKNVSGGMGKTASTTVNQVKCEECGQTFNSRERLNEHTRESHAGFKGRADANRQGGGNMGGTGGAKPGAGAGNPGTRR